MRIFLNSGGVTMKIWLLPAVACLCMIPAGAGVLKADVAPQQTVVFSAVVLILHVPEQSLPVTKSFTMEQSVQSEAYRVTLGDGICLLFAQGRYVLLDHANRVAVRVAGQYGPEDWFRAFGLPEPRKAGKAIIARQATGRVEHLGYRCYVVDAQVKEGTLHSQRTEWVAKIGGKEVVLRRFEKTSGSLPSYFLQEAYKVARISPQNLFTVPSSYSVREAQNLLEAVRNLQQSREEGGR
jgi:hypothetical protein